MEKLTGADDIASNVKSGLEVVGALTYVISTFHVTIAVQALTRECATLVQLLACVFNNIKSNYCTGNDYKFRRSNWKKFNRYQLVIFDWGQQMSC